MIKQAGFTGGKKMTGNKKMPTSTIQDQFFKIFNRAAIVQNHSLTNNQLV